MSFNRFAPGDCPSCGGVVETVDCSCVHRILNFYPHSAITAARVDIDEQRIVLEYDVNDLREIRAVNSGGQPVIRSAILRDGGAFWHVHGVWADLSTPADGSEFDALVAGAPNTEIATVDFDIAPWLPPATSKITVLLTPVTPPPFLGPTTTATPLLIVETTEVDVPLQLTYDWRDDFQQTSLGEYEYTKELPRRDNVLVSFVGGGADEFFSNDGARFEFELFNAETDDVLFKQGFEKRTGPGGVGDEVFSTFGSLNRFYDIVGQSGLGEQSHWPWITENSGRITSDGDAGVWHHATQQPGSDFAPVSYTHLTLPTKA